MDRVKGKAAIVTGGASGIGEATARLLAAEGAVVAVADIDDANGRRVVKGIKSSAGAADFWHLDVSNEAEVAAVFAAVYKKFGKLHILVNNAGIAGYPKPTHETSVGEWDKVINTNLKGTFLCVKYAVPYIKKSGGGSVVNLSSIMGLIGGGDPVYHASKGGVRVMTKSDATVYAPDNIRFNSVHPGFIDTPLYRKLAQKRSPGKVEEEIQGRGASVPLGRIGKPEDIARGILFLASDESSYITGAELVIDGGFTVWPAGR